MSKRFAFVAALVAIASPSSAAIEARRAPDTVDDLYRVSSSKFDEVYLFLGADFKRYKNVMIDQPEVAFRPTWLGDYNRSQRDPSARLNDSEASAILSSARDGLEQIFSDAFTKAGYPVVTSAAPDVLRIKVEVINLAITAPQKSVPVRSRTYAREAGQAKIIVEIRDSVSGAVLGRAVDARTIGESGLSVRTKASNRADFERAFKQWANVSVAGVNALTEHDPVR